MKVLKYTYNPNKKGVFKVSVVKNPAVGEGDLVLMSAQEIKGIFYSPVMIPDLKIQRVGEDGEPYMVYYDSDTIEQLSNNYWKQCGNSETNLDHADNVEGVYPVESWIVKNPEQDKSKAIGMPLQKEGTWIMGYKADSPEVLQKIKDKLLQGLSIEGFLDAEEEMSINFNKQEMSKTILEKAQELLGLIKMSSDAPEKTQEEIDAEKKAEMDAAEEAAKAAEAAAAGDGSGASDMEKELATAKATIEEKDKQIAELEAKLATYENDAVLMSAQIDEIQKAFTAHKAVTMSSQKLGDQPKPAVTKTYAEMSNAEKVKYNRNK